MSSVLPPCVLCGTLLVPDIEGRKHGVPEGHRRHGGRGMCYPCYRRTRRREKAAPEIAAPVRRTDEPWRADAQCLDEDPDLWFPVAENPAHHTWDEPRAICSACPVVAQCLDDALATETTSTRFGIRGGMGPDEREAEARTRSTIARVLRGPARSVTKGQR